MKNNIQALTSRSTIIPPFTIARRLLQTVVLKLNRWNANLKMRQRSKKTIFYVLIGLSIIGIPVFAFGILNTMVSLKYETNNPSDCISLVTGANLCSTVNVLKGLIFACFTTIVTITALRKYFIN